MSGTRAGGLKTKAKNLARDPDFYSKNGQLGGNAVHTKPRGFAARRDVAIWAGKKGGEVSRRSKNAR